MRTTHGWTHVRRSVALAASAIVTLASASSVVAQERPLGLLNKIDVRALVARGDPVDNDRLFVHFRVLLDRYLSEAERHESAARNFIGNPNRTFDGGTSEHCRRLAKANRQMAETVRELALYHRHLADGAPATLPSGGARFQTGTGAPDPTEEELKAWAARAHSRTDHLALAEYLRMVAARYTRTANEHMMQALTYRGGRFAQAAVHHEHLSREAREAARRASMTAERHGQYAVLGR